MPVVVVALAAGSFAAGATAFAAATTLAGAVAAGAVMVGSALTIVGTVTGNERLAKIGGIIGLAGGLGSLAVSASNAAATAAETGVANAATDAATNVATDAATDAASSAASDAAVQTGAVDLTTTTTQPLADSSSGMLSAANDVGQGASSTVAGPMTDVQSQGMLNAAQNPTAAADATAQTAFDASNTAAGQANNTQAFDPSATQAGSTTNQNAFDPNQSSAETARLGRQDGMLAAAQDPGMVGKLQAWAKSNPNLAKMALETVKGVAGSLVPSPKDQAMMDLYRQQTETLKRRAAYGAGRTY